MTNPTPSEEELLWGEWKQHPMTKKLMAWAEGERQLLQEDWANSKFLGEGQFGTAMVNAKAVAQCELLAEIAELEFETIFGDRNG